MFAQTPENLSLQFFGLYLDQTGARSSTCAPKDHKYFWHRKDLPELFSPLNTMDAVK